MMRKAFITFAGAGSVATAIHFGVLIAAVSAFGAPPVLGSSLGFAASVIANYMLNYHYTFKSTQPHAQAATRFILIYSLGFLINAAIMKIGVDVLHIHYIVVQLGATGIVLLWNFFGSYLWSFRDSRNSGAGVR